MNRRGWVIFGALIALMVLVGVTGVTAANLSDPETSSGNVMRGMAEWYSFDWAYRQGVTLTSSAALTNYEMKLVVDTQTLVTATKMQSDLDDLRFTSSDGTTELYYFIEMDAASLPSSSTVIWVKVPAVANGSTTIYMYYGNSGAVQSSYEDGWNTFLFFDDFETLTGGQFANWTRANTGTFSQVATHAVGSYGGRFDDTATSNAFAATSIAFRAAAADPVIVEYYAYPEVQDITGVIDDMDFRVQRGTSIGSAHLFNAAGNIQYYLAATPTTIMGYSANHWYQVLLDQIDWVTGSANDNHDIWIGVDGAAPSLQVTNARSRTDLNNTIDRIALRGPASADRPQVVFDCIKVRQWVASVPTYVFGSEE